MKIVFCFLIIALICLFIFINLRMKPSEARVVEVNATFFCIEVKHGLLWNSLQTVDEISKITGYQCDFSYPFNNKQVADRVCAEINKKLMQK